MIEHLITSPVVRNFLVEALTTATAGVMLSLLFAVIPQAAAALAHFINTNKEIHKNKIANIAIAEAVAYFKAHQTEMAAAGTTMVDYAIARLQLKLPDMERLEAEHAVQLFLSDLSQDLQTS